MLYVRDLSQFHAPWRGLLPAPAVDGRAPDNTPVDVQNLSGTRKGTAASPQQMLRSVRFMQ